MILKNRGREGVGTKLGQLGGTQIPRLRSVACGGLTPLGMTIHLSMGDRLSAGSAVDRTRSVKRTGLN